MYVYMYMYMYNHVSHMLQYTPTGRYTCTYMYIHTCTVYDTNAIPHMHQWVNAALFCYCFTGLYMYIINHMLQCTQSLSLVIHVPACVICVNPLFFHTCTNVAEWLYIYTFIRIHGW